MPQNLILMQTFLFMQLWKGSMFQISIYLKFLKLVINLLYLFTSFPFTEFRIYLHNKYYLARGLIYEVFFPSCE